ncbi:ABC transporter ATP-binding protein [Pontibacter sp. Tf4]|uniref:ABC transporter ATP-binding protein n=1 Tax=Pontibacter sp. Tf4 TaxID=2761620 RepID=UPI001628E03C|nr:ABC transporter ATP-binding protein [Pontibacter sp. Tf4]MBB6609420.1 ABC transporter ATP-binding protein [Pontibacter sp. Tf4]
MRTIITKHIKAGLLALFLLAGGAVQAQNQDPDAPDIRDIDKAHDRIIKVHPLQLGEAYLSVEKLRTERVSNEYGIGYIYKSYLKGETDDWQDYEAKDVTGIGIHMSQRHYTSNKKSAPFGFFHGPVFGYRFLVYEKNVFDLPEQDPSSPDFRFVGRLYQNSLDVSYRIGGQFLLGNHFTLEVAGSLGGRVKYAKSTTADELLPQHIIGYELISDESSYVAATPLAQLKFSVGYAF